MHWAVIMAGGNGTRFWPLSTPRSPKQFLPLLDGENLSQACIQRLAPFVAPERLLLVAAESHRSALQKALPTFPESQILWEPVGRNTAPCIAWASEHIRHRDPEAIIAVFPSDHVIKAGEAFETALKRAYEAAHNGIILFGIRATRPETGYGYIEIGEALDHAKELYRVAAFCEKPQLERAQHYLDGGRHLWNSGIFIYSAQIMHEEIERFLPELSAGIAKIIQKPSDIEAIFPSLPSISIDYAVMEKSQRCQVIAANFNWDDLGTWSALRPYLKSDAAGMTKRGKVYSLDCQNCFAYASDGKKIALLGVKDLIVVATDDALLVMDASRCQDLRELSQAAEEEAPYGV